MAGLGHPVARLQALAASAEATGDIVGNPSGKVDVDIPSLVRVATALAGTRYPNAECASSPKTVANFFAPQSPTPPTTYNFERVQIHPPRVILRSEGTQNNMSAAATPSPLQLAANRANAQLSTGPVTAGGKVASSRNAISHGLCSRDILLPTEDPAAYQDYRLRVLARFQPETDTQLEMANEYTDLAWRLKRIPVFIANLVKVEIHIQSLVPEEGVHFAARTQEEQVAVAQYLLMDQKKLQNLWTHEARIHRRLEKIRKQLEAELADRLAPVPPQPAKPAVEPNRKNEPISAPAPRPVPFVRAPEPGRNELCPCKSGLKFKRCCLDKPYSAAAVAA